MAVYTQVPKFSNHNTYGEALKPGACIPGRHEQRYIMDNQVFYNMGSSWPRVPSTLKYCANPQKPTLSRSKYALMASYWYAWCRCTLWITNGFL